MKRSDFKLEPELKGMKVADIKKHVRAFNKHYAIQGYSKLKKTELVSAILSAQMRLGGAKKTKKKLVVVEAPAKKATPAPKKATPAPKKASASNTLTSNRQVVQALLDGAIHLLNIDHINEVENDSTARMLGVETISERKELLKKFQDSPALSKKLLAYDFFRFGRVRKQVGIQKIPLNLFKEINENMKLIEEKLRTELGRDTATGKLKTLETSTRPKAVRDLKEYLALPLWKKVEKAVTKYDYGDDNKTGFQFLRAMIELV